jgi:hypothetical protein
MAQFHPSKKFNLDSFDVTVCQNNKCQPFINAFRFEGANFEEQQMGVLFGIITTRDQSKNSEYLPNLIAQVIKKEFFRLPKRDYAKSFENAFQKANIALAELAQHEIIEWMGNLHAIIGVIKNDDFIFTQSGGGSILLVRDKNITDLTRGMNDEKTPPHPLKTFHYVSQGKLEDYDKLLFLTESVFQTLHWEDLKTHIQKLDSASFDNLFRSILETQAALAAAMVINLKPKELPPQTEPLARTPLEELNFFGKDPAEKKVPYPHIGKSSTALITNNTAAAPALFTTPAAIQSDNPASTQQTPPLERKTELFIRENQPEKHIAPENQPAIKKNTPSLREKITSLLKNFSARRNLWYQKIKIAGWPLLQSADAFLRLILRKIRRKTKRLIAAAKKQFAKTPDKIIPVNFRSTTNQPGAPAVRFFFSTLQNQIFRLIATGKALWRRIPFTPKTKRVFSSLLLLSGCLIFFLLIFHQPENKTPAPNTADADSDKNSLPSASQLKIPEENADSTLIKDVRLLNQFDTDIIAVSGIRKEIFVLTKDKEFYVYNPGKNQAEKIAMPFEPADFRLLVPMKPLLLMFLISNDQVYSYSPVTRRFEKNAIDLPAQAELTGAGAYLTYLYVFDKKSRQIYQYARAAGGFGEKKEWLKVQLTDNNITDLDIDGSIYLTDGRQKLIKLFQKKETPFNLEQTLPDLNTTKIQSDNENNPIFILDSQHGRIVIFSKEGKLLRQFWSETLLEAKDFWIEETKKEAFFVTRDNRLMQFNLTW